CELSVSSVAQVAVSCYISPMTMLAPRANLNDQAYETLRQRILTRDPGPGAKLSLHELAAELGVSRSPGHHALTRLVSEGLLSVKARRGYFVTPVTSQALLEGYEVRLPAPPPPGGGAAHDPPAPRA